MQLEEFMARMPKGDFWVFGYGSLMWSPCFSYEAKAPGRAHGYHRALCILSTRYRGTLHRPGLVMGLCQGGSCWGMAFKIGRRDVRRTLARLWAREMPRRVYHPRMVAVKLRGGRSVRALAFVANPTHSAYVDELDLHGRAKLVAQGIGVRGPCVDYIQNTLDHMHEVGVRDPHLERVLHAAQELRRGDGGAHSSKSLAQARTLRAKVEPHEARLAKLRPRG
jgi:glutathione-specific gamma-glutamylcyclotransferase